MLYMTTKSLFSQICSHAWTNGAKLLVPLHVHKPSHNVAKALNSKSVLTNPYTWTNQQLRTWLTSVDDGKFEQYVDNLASVVDGKQLKKWPLMRYKQVG